METECIIVLTKHEQSYWPVRQMARHTRSLVASEKKKKRCNVKITFIYKIRQDSRYLIIKKIYTYL